MQTAPNFPAWANQRGLRRAAAGLTAVTIGWNSVEAVVAIGSGVAANSIALVGFGLDSVVEVSSALVIVWLLLMQRRNAAQAAQFEKRAVRLISATFVVVAVYVTFESATSLLGFGAEADASTVGMILLALSLVVMPSHTYLKLRVATELNSVSLRADARNTQLCTNLSAVVLVSIGSNAALGWWWLDPIAGLVVAGLAAREGVNAWRSGDLCDC